MMRKAVIYDLLFKAAADTTLTVAADPKHLGARIGVSAVLHTWGSAMTHHPHLHMIVPGSGLSRDGKKWLACRPGFFLPVRVLSRLFRRLFLKKLACAHASGRLAFFGDHAALANAAAFAALLTPLRKAGPVHERRHLRLRSLRRGRHRPCVGKAGADVAHLDRRLPRPAKRGQAGLAGRARKYRLR
jgi:hypothetical protein